MPIHSRANHRSVREGGTSSRHDGSRCGSCLGRVEAGRALAPATVFVILTSKLASGEASRPRGRQRNDSINAELLQWAMTVDVARAASLLSPNPLSEAALSFGGNNGRSK